MICVYVTTKCDKNYQANSFTDNPTKELLQYYTYPVEECCRFFVLMKDGLKLSMAIFILSLIDLVDVLSNYVNPK